jgi:starch synthase (maltosyl-transferring)
LESVPLPKTNDPPPRIQIQRVTPQIDGGKYAVKRTVGETVEVSARIFRDGHEALGAAVRY